MTRREGVAENRLAVGRSLGTGRGLGAGRGFGLGRWLVVRRHWDGEVGEMGRKAIFGERIRRATRRLG